jgi:hypothetical protein
MKQKNGPLSEGHFFKVKEWPCLPQDKASFKRSTHDGSQGALRLRRYFSPATF